jgi:hypothetical protein
MQAADTLQRVGDNLSLPLELRGVSEVLDLTAAAIAEHGTERLRAIRRFRQKLEHFGDGVLRLDRDDPHAGAFRRERPEAKHDHAAASPDGLAVGHEAGKLDLAFVASAQHDRALRARAAGAFAGSAENQPSSYRR